MSEYLEFRNISSIITSVLLTVFGLLLGYLSSIGFDLPVTADVLATLVGGSILAIFSYYNAKHQNNLFDEENDTIYIPVDNLNTAQIKTINKIIKSCVDENMVHQCNCDNCDGECNDDC